jgi:hypothetical protein
MFALSHRRKALSRAPHVALIHRRPRLLQAPLQSHGPAAFAAPSRYAPGASSLTRSRRCRPGSATKSSTG